MTAPLTGGEIRGEVAPGWEPVHHAFATIMRRSGQRGAGLHVIHRGRPVVDLYGGHADDREERPYGPDTGQVVFSASKGVAAACLAVLAERGDLDLDAPMVRYWPEFGCHGKAALTVAQVLSHQAGLVAPAQRPTLDDVLAGRPLADALAAEPPAWRPGRPGYHAVTWGVLADELVRRITGGRLGEVLDELVCRPRDLAISIGTGPGREVAPVHAAPRTLLARWLEAVLARPGTPAWRAMTVQGALVQPPDIWVRRADVLAAQLPAVNAVATAPSLARLYAALLPGADAPLVGDRTRAAVTAPRVSGRDRVLGVRSAFACGFALPSRAWRLGSATAFGHPGIGGALGLADPRRLLAVAFLPRLMPADALRDPRHRLLLDAISTSVERAPR
jgi:CubicO group peptidase (beta-lactamase class C family)